VQSLLPTVSRQAWLVCGLLVAQALGLVLVSRPEQPPPARPLQEFPTELGAWRMVQEGVIEERVREKLRAGDLLNRVYGAPGRPLVNLYIAYFPTQRTGVAPHSPKNCLPGSGWVPVESAIVRLPVGAAGWFEVNRYVVENGDRRSLVLYWYQSHERSIASEYKAKVYAVVDALRYRRSDTALVRVVVPAELSGISGATGVASEFARLVYEVLVGQFPQFQPI